MDSQTRKRIEEIDKQIEQLLQEKYSLNPFAKLKDMSWKEFGEDFSENYVLDHTPNLTSARGAGHDMHSEKLGYIEVKSGRLPYKNGWTMNQLHPSECDYFLFVFYNTIEATVDLFLVSSSTLTDSGEFKLTKQHGEGCFSMGETRKNSEALQKYRVDDWEKLNSLV